MSIVATVKKKIGRAAAEGIYDNPVVIKDMRTRMRGTKAFVVMGGYVLFLVVVLVIAAYVILSEVLRSQNAASSIINRSVGLRLFEALTWTQAILLALVSPSLTSGALSQEVESKTMEMLSLTRLTPGKIVLGKQLSGFFYSLMLLVCSVPLAGICLMFGGISPLEIAVTYALLAAWAFLFTSTGVMWSSLVNKTSVASLVSFATCAGYTFMTFVCSVEYGPTSSSSESVFHGLNPGWASESALMATNVCGLSVPIALAAFIMHAGLGALALLIASTHLKYHRVERAMSIRLMLLGLSVFSMWLIVGNGMSVGLRMSGTLPSTAALNLICACAIGVLLLVAVWSTVIATGRLTTARGESFIAYAFSPAKAFKSDLRGAINFLMIWTAAAYAAFGGTFLWVAKAGGVPIFASFWTAYLKVGVALLAISAGLGALGVLCSSMLKTRRNAAMLLVLVVILLLAVYPVIGAYFEPGISNPRAFVWQLAALWPMMPILHTTGNLGYSGGPLLWWSSSDAWLVTCIVYALITMSALGLASALAGKYGGVRED